MAGVAIVAQLGHEPVRVRERGIEPLEHEVALQQHGKQADEFWRQGEHANTAAPALHAGAYRRLGGASRDAAPRRLFEGVHHIAGSEQDDALIVREVDGDVARRAGAVQFGEQLAEVGKRRPKVRVQRFVFGEHHQGLPPWGCRFHGPGWPWFRNSAGAWWPLRRPRFRASNHGPWSRRRSPRRTA